MPNQVCLIPPENCYRYVDLLWPSNAAQDVAIGMAEVAPTLACADILGKDYTAALEEAERLMPFSDILLHIEVEFDCELVDE